MSCYSASIQAMIMDQEANRNRTCHSVCGVVTKHDFREDGWCLIFKRRIPRIHVRIYKKQLVRFHNSCAYIRPVINVSFDDKDQRDCYPIGTKINLTFGYANAHDQDFGAVPLKLLDIQPINNVPKHYPRE